MSSKRHAIFVVDSILEAVDLLQKHPKIGRVVPEVNVVNLREIIVKRYRVVYYINFHDDIEIVTIRHSSQSWPDTLLPFLQG